MTVADIAIFIWALSAAWCGIDIAEFPAVKEWRDRISQRPGIKRGLRVPIAYPFSDEKVLDPKRKKIYEVIQKHGTEMNRNELQELTRGRENL
jgi:glutathione S-transferase